MLRMLSDNGSSDARAVPSRKEVNYSIDETSITIARSLIGERVNFRGIESNCHDS